jgi:outer membrane protein assembly factor BamA
MRKLYGNFYLIGGYLYEQRVIKAAPSSRLKLNSPLGSSGGRDSELRLGIAYNSTDDETMPSKGTFTDFYIELPQKWLGSSYSYERFTFTNRNYLKLSRRLVWGSRFVMKVSGGTVPFYEMAKVGGYIHFDGLGGGATIRGVRQSRVIDENVYFFNEELRFFVTDFYIGRQRFDIYLLPFVDFGRVFSGINDFSFANMHLGGGGGARICWNKNFIIAPDFGISSEGYGIYFSFRNMF